MNRAEWKKQKKRNLRAVQKKLEAAKRKLGEFEAQHGIEKLRKMLKIVSQWNRLKGKANPKNTPKEADLPADHVQCRAALCATCTHDDKPIFDGRFPCDLCHDGDNPKRCGEIVLRDDFEREGWTRDEYTCGHTDDHTNYFCPTHSTSATKKYYKCEWCNQDL